MSAFFLVGHYKQHSDSPKHEGLVVVPMTQLACFYVHGDTQDVTVFFDELEKPLIMQDVEIVEGGDRLFRRIPHRLHPEANT